MNKFNRYKHTRASTALISFIILLSISGCTVSRSLLYSFKSTNHFLPFPSDGRIFYEAGAENFAARVAEDLPDLIQKIEARHYAGFIQEINVMLCKSPDSFKNLTGSKAKAIMFRKKIFLSPAMMNNPDDVLLYLGHELSHLLMHQNTGGYAYIKIPSWFHEGMASFVSDGGGAQNTTSREAQHAILSGSNFLPLDSAGITDVFRPKYGSYWKLDNQMFYRQAMLFVGYLKYRNMDSFRAFLTDIQNGNNFAESFNKTFGMTTLEMWDEFIDGLES